MNDEQIEDIAAFSVLIKNALKAIGIHKSSQLAQLNANDLDRIDQVGRKGKLAIVDYCQRNAILFSDRSFFGNRIDPDLQMGIQRSMYLIVTSRSQQYARK